MKHELCENCLIFIISSKTLEGRLLIWSMKWARIKDASPDGPSSDSHFGKCGKCSSLSDVSFHLELTHSTARFQPGAGWSHTKQTGDGIGGWAWDTSHQHWSKSSSCFGTGMMGVVISTSLTPGLLEVNKHTPYHCHACSLKHFAYGHNHLHARVCDYAACTIHTAAIWDAAAGLWLMVPFTSRPTRQVPLPHTAISFQ